MNEEFFKFLGNVSAFIVIVPILLAFYRFKKLNTVQIRLLYLLVLVLIVEFISNMLWRKKINNLPVYHFYAVIEFLLIVNMYRYVLSRIFSKLFFIVLSAAFIVFAISNTLFFQGLNTFNSNVTTLLGIVVIFLALSYFYALLKEIRYSALETNPMFWINAGFLIYFSSNLILFFINNNMFKGSTEASYLVWGLHAIVNIVLMLFYITALWVNPKKL